MSEIVDEAVANALHQVSKRRTGVKEVDDFVDQSLITLGGMVKMTSMVRHLDVPEMDKSLMAASLNAYRIVINRLAHSILGDADA